MQAEESKIKASFKAGAVSQDRLCSTRWPTKSQRPRAQLPSTKSLRLKPSRYPQNIVLHFDPASGKLSFNAVFEFRDRRSSVLAVEAAGVVHENDMSRHAMFEDRLQFRGKALPVTLQAGPAVVAGVEPEERRAVQRFQ